MDPLAAVPAASALAAAGAAARAGEPDLEAVRHLWTSVVVQAFVDMRDGPPRLVADAAAWITGDSETLNLAVDVLEADLELMRRAARRLLGWRFGELEAARLLGQPLVPLRPRRRRRVRAVA